MAIEGISNSANYQDIAKVAPKTEMNTTNQRTNYSSPNTVNQTITAVFREEGEGSNLSEDNKHNKGGEASASQIRAAISEANLKATRTRCEFSVNDPTNRISIKIIDKETDKVIREIPAEESLEMIAKIWELAGLLVDEKR